MAKISTMPIAEDLAGGEILPVVQGGTAKRMTLAVLRSAIVPYLQAWYKGDQGDTGPANSTYTRLAALQAAPVTNRSYHFAPDAADTSGFPAAPYFYKLGDFSGVQYAADFVSGDKVKLTAVPLATGALVRQNANSVSYRQISAGTALDRITGSSQLDAFIAGLRGEYAEDATTILEQLFAQSASDHRDVAGHAHLPRGQYSQTRSFKMPNSAVLSGDGPRATKLQSYVDGNRAFPLLTNADSGGALFQTIRQIALWGGTAGYHIDATGGCDDIRFQDVTFFGQTQAGIVCERLFQTTELRNVEFDQCTRGIWVKEHTSNAIFIFGGAFKNLAEAALDLNGVEALVCVGTRFEGGGDSTQPDKATINLQNVRNISFISCYFENTHPVLLRSRRTGGLGAALANGGTIAFTSCHFTQAVGEVPYGWDVEGAISFTDCDFYLPTRVPSQAQVRGHNRNLVHSIRAGQLTSKQITPVLGLNYLLTINLSDALPVVSNLNVLTGRLTTTFARIDVNGVGYTTFSREYLVVVRSLAGLALDGSVKLVQSADVEGGATLAIGITGQTSQALQIFANVQGVAADDPVRFLSYTFSWVQGSSRAGNLYDVGLA
ncbi:hypothetical protein [Sphingomonas aracearum]|uniref:Pectate lyase superfamily protein domain-containing protein n=1 Tax=Sphingomonas aracearum TaxID=2283317 RepID=A0A369VQM0_9SPHN|nr:hypothetical protein [Sphingomonas aracearum]RDE04684.1 hypothetical protein DVW87_13930 [Sphingomonas aracearum]